MLTNLNYHLGKDKNVIILILCVDYSTIGIIILLGGIYMIDYFGIANGEEETVELKENVKVKVKESDMIFEGVSGKISNFKVIKKIRNTVYILHFSTNSDIIGVYTYEGYEVEA